MNYISDFWVNLGSPTTTVIIGFLTGYVIGISKLSNNSALIGLVFGLLMAVLVGMLSSFIGYVLPQQITVSINLRSMFTLVLLIVFFVMVSFVGVK